LRRQPSLRSQLNQIRLWVRQGRTDAWIAHTLDVSIDQLERFKRDHDLDSETSAAGPPADPLSVPPPLPEPEYEEDAGDESEGLDEDEDEEVADERPAPRRRDGRRGRGGRGGRPRDRGEREERAEEEERAEQEDREPENETGAATEDGEQPRRRRRRGRRGGRRRRRPGAYEATFDHGEEGYGLWLDPAVVDNPVYTEHWAGHRAVVVTFDQDAITIRRAGQEPERGDSPEGESEDLD
jgi:hypothetical protein